MSAVRLHLGISPCPNDTFAFHGLLEGHVPTPGLELEIELADVEELNRGLLAGRYDAAKASFAAALELAGDVVVLPAGSALGFGVGPLLLAREPGRDLDDPGERDARVLCPGAHTTATLLLRLFHPGRGRVEQVVFSEILPALERGRADFGVCIHEGRFTYAERGLARVEDLGERWEARTGAPLPLGGIVARRDLGRATLEALSTAIAASIEHARACPDEALVTMRRHARELADTVLWRHVELYVNEWTRDLGPEGRRALAALSAEARRAGVLARDAPALEVFER